MMTKLACITLVSVAAIGTYRPPLRVQEPAPRSASDGIYTEAQAARGREFYVDHCVSCHGDALVGQSAPPLTGDEFMSRWSDKTFRDLFEQIRVTMPPDGAGTLSRQQVADILAYKLHVEKFPAGTTDLGVDPDLLKQFRIIERPSRK
jgi:mono/diheme cytochrome c family protein